MKKNSDMQIFFSLLKNTPDAGIFGDFFSARFLHNTDFDGFSPYSFPDDFRNIDFFASYRSGELLSKKYTLEASLECFLIIDSSFFHKKTMEKMKYFCLLLGGASKKFNFLLSGKSFIDRIVHYDDIFSYLYQNNFYKLSVDFAIPETKIPENAVIFFVSDDFKNQIFFERLPHAKKFFCFFDYDIIEEKKKGVFSSNVFINTKQNRQDFMKEKSKFLEKKQKEIYNFGGEFLFFGQNISVAESIQRYLLGKKSFVF